ncbi:MAG TPA: hypothetical protein VF595_06425 [Tepidisphaeraceae bacterium]|jgi:hypothetical protein
MTTQDQQTWTHIGVSFGCQPFLVNGLNVWSLDWRTGDAHEKASVLDPVYGRPFEFNVYRFATGNRETVFAAGEFSNNVWGFYVPANGVNTPATTQVAATAPVRPAMWHLFMPYVPAAAALFSVPWIVLVIMMNIGGQGAHRTNPNWRELFVAESIAPAVCGLLIGLVSLRVARSWNAVAWVGYVLGCIGCAAVIVGMCVAG